MRRAEFEHLIRAAGALLQVDHLIVIGSQAILGSFPHWQLPPETTQSVEVDFVPPDDPDERLADILTGTIGEGSPFHEAFGIYADDVSIQTARLPKGWDQRLVVFETP